MNYLKASDYSKQIKQDSLSAIIENDEAIRQDAENAVEEEINSYLGSNYDLSKEFLPLLDYDSGKNYSIGDRVLFNDLIYVAKAETVNNEPDNENFWTKGDNRNPLIKMYFVDMVLYHLHSRVNPRNIPQLRMDRYDAAIKALNSGLVFNLPEWPTDENTTPIHWGSNKKFNHYF
jgi:hypothetical protein